MSIAATASGEGVSQEFDELFREHFQFLYCTAYTVTGGRQDAEDVVQTIFLRLIRRDVPPALRKSPKAYLYRAAINESLNIIRSRKRHSFTDDMDCVKALSTPPATNPDDELQRSMTGAMALPLACVGLTFNSCLSKCSSSNVVDVCAPRPCRRDANKNQYHPQSTFCAAFGMKC